MKKPVYQGSATMKQAEQIRQIWIKEYQREQKGKLTRVLPAFLSFSVGYYSGVLNHTARAWLISVLVSLLLFYLFRFLRVTYKINFL